MALAVAQAEQSCTGDLEASTRHSGSSEAGESLAAGALAGATGARAIAPGIGDERRA